MTTERFGLKDEPITEIGQENLGLGAYAQALGTFVLACDTPLTISLQGDWGSGKTSLMNLIRTAIANDTQVNKIVWFNTWQYSQFNQSDQLPLSMLSSLLEGVMEPEDGRKQQLQTIFGAVARFAVVGVGAVFGQGEAAREALEAASTQGSSTPMDPATTIRRMKETIQQIVDERLKCHPGGRIIFFIDDLDRLVPARAVELLEVMKNFLDLRGCVFVLACDYQVVIQGLKDKFGMGEGDMRGKSFFDKIIQVPFNMPLHQYQVNQYFANLLDGIGVSFQKPDIDLYAKLVNTSVGFNPRSMKRLFNSLQLLKLVLDQKDDLRKQLARYRHGEWERILFGILCMQNAFPELFAFIAQSPMTQHLFEGLSDEEILRAHAEFLPLRAMLPQPIDEQFYGRMADFAEAFYEAIQLDTDRKNLSAEEERVLTSLFSFSKVVSTEAATPQKTSEDQFVQACVGEEIDYYERIFALLHQHGIQHRLGVKGFSIIDRAGKAVMYCHPTNCRRHNEVLQENLPAERLQAVREFLATHAPLIPEESRVDKRIIFKASDLPIALMRQLILIATGMEARVTVGDMLSGV